MSSTVEPTSPLKAVMRILRHQGAAMAVFVLAVIGATAVGTILSPRAYRSQSRILLRLGRENATLDPTVTLGGQAVVSVPYTRDLEINTALDLITSRALAEQLLATLGPDVILGLAPMDQAAPVDPSSEQGERSDTWQAALELFRKNLSAEIVKKSSVLAVNYEASSPTLAQAVLSRYIALFAEKHSLMSRTPGATQFLATQAARLEKAVELTEDELRRKKASTGLTSPETQRQLLAARMGRLEDELGQATASLAATEAEVLGLEQQVGRTPPEHATAITKGIASQAADQVRAQVASLKIKEAEMTARHGESHPEVRQVRRQLSTAEDVLRKEEASREQVTTGPNKLHEEGQVALLKQRAASAALRARIKAIETQLRSERDRLAEFTLAELEVMRLQRKLDLEIGQLKRYSEGLEQGQVDRALQAEKISNIAIVQSASYEPKPVRPKLSMNLALGAGFALIGAAGLGYLLDQRTRGKDAGK